MPQCHRRQIDKRCGPVFSAAGAGHHKGKAVPRPSSRPIRRLQPTGKQLYLPHELQLAVPDARRQSPAFQHAHRIIPSLERLPLFHQRLEELPCPTAVS